MLSLESFSPDNIFEVLRPVTESYGGADSRVYHVEQFAIHHYKPHVDEKLFNLYLQATINSAAILDGLVQLPNSREQINVLVNPILKWFISHSGNIVSISHWISGEKGSDFEKTGYKKKYLSLIPVLNQQLNVKCRPRGAEIVSLNTKYSFPFLRNPHCTITDVGNGLRYIRG